MISSDSRAATVVTVLPAISAAATANATSGWIDVRPYKGTLKFLVNTGTISGSVTGKLRSATDGSGSGAADITGATHAVVNTPSQIRTIIIPATTCPYVQYVGTVVTGPVLISVTLEAHPGLTG
jgi:hypothetical protein